MRFLLLYLISSFDYIYISFLFENTRFIRLLRHLLETMAILRFTIWQT